MKRLSGAIERAAEELRTLTTPVEDMAQAARILPDRYVVSDHGAFETARDFFMNAVGVISGKTTFLKPMDTGAQLDAIREAEVLRKSILQEKQMGAEMALILAFLGTIAVVMLGLIGYGGFLVYDATDQWLHPKNAPIEPTPIVREKRPTSARLALTPTPTELFLTPTLVPTTFPTPRPTARVGETYCTPMDSLSNIESLATTLSYGVAWQPIPEQSKQELRALQKKLKPGETTSPCVVRAKK